MKSSNCCSASGLLSISCIHWKTKEILLFISTCLQMLLFFFSLIFSSLLC
uniref:Uncharacterized protein n=1 Tax=Rhizophora mucronata TaxID=61149 RepID=A0A2P2NYX4_RHIMU